MKTKIFSVLLSALVIIIAATSFFFINSAKNSFIAQKDNLIEVFKPRSSSFIQSPLEIEGLARGYWFFEATFPVVLTNWDGLIIAESYAQAQDDWMTEEYVPFKATLNFEKPAYGERGFLILKKDNPSGLPENDDSLEIPIRFK